MKLDEGKEERNFRNTHLPEGEVRTSFGKFPSPSVSCTPTEVVALLLKLANAIPGYLLHSEIQKFIK